MLGGWERKEEEAETTAKEFASHLVLAFLFLQMECILRFQGIRLVGQRDMGTASLALGIHWALFYSCPTLPADFSVT